MIGLYIALGVIGLFLILFFIGLFVIYHGSFYTPHKGQDNHFYLTQATIDLGIDGDIIKLINSLLEVPYEDAYIKSFDHKKLHANIYKNPKSKKVMIMCHGYRGTNIRDFSGAGRYVIDKGFNVILIDERGHGKSKGHSITFGVREYKDVLSWVDYAYQTFGEDIELYLAGISMGAASVLFAAEHLKKPAKIIADCPFSTPKEIIVETIKTTLKLNPKIFWPITNLSLILFGHTSLNQLDASRSVKNSNSKFLIIHGEDDTVVPYKLSYRIYEENKDKVKYELFPKTNHGVSFVTDMPRYKKLLDEFLK